MLIGYSSDLHNIADYIFLLVASHASGSVGKFKLCLCRI